MKPIVFINYRRDDAAAEAMLIYEALKDRLGESAVFIDVSTVKPGTEWPPGIKNALHAAEVVIGVIGRNWLKIKNEHEQRRIDLEDDWVRLELATALTSNKKIIPVYVDGAAPLAKSAFNPSIEGLSDIDGITLRHDHWPNDLNLLLEQFPARAKEEPAPQSAAPRSSKELKQRQDFLDLIERDVTHRLASSVHAARFMDLGITHDTNAVGTMWGYRDPHTQQEYQNLSEAFEMSKGRLLLLGHPGSGKTTALLHLAQTLIAQARASEDAPVPFFVNLSKYNLPTTPKENVQEARLDERFDDWLAREMAGVPGMTSVRAKQWLADGHVAALLDGLDEFNDDRRPELARLINTSFLQRHPHMVVVVCSRTNDYQLLRGTANAIQLNDAVELQPLTDPQIDEYLRAAQAEGLRDAIRADASLRELAKSPLTLSMLALAYGGLPPEQMPKALSLTESRHRLFEAYVDRRMQREARRKAGRQMNDSREHDVPIKHYCYTPKQVHRWLGYLAVVLSQRMTTVFSIDGFYELLSSSTIPNDPKIWRASLKFARGVWLSLLALLVTAPILPFTLEGGLWLALIFATCFVAVWIPAIENDDSEIILIVGLGCMTIGAAMLAHFTIVWLGRGLAAPLSLVVQAALIAIMFVLFSTLDHIRGRNNSGEGTRLTVSSIVALAAGLGAWWMGDYLNVGINSSWLAALAVTVLWTIGVNFIEKPSFVASVVTLCLCAGTCVIAYFLGHPGWKITSLAAAAGVVSLSILSSNLPVLLLWTATSAICGIFFGVPGLALSSSSLLVFCFVGMEFSGTSDKPSRLDRAHHRMHLRLVASLLNPGVWCGWALARAFPWRKPHFVNFCEQIHLLKKSSEEGIEFIHRLLRDYFALCHLKPIVEMLEGGGRLSAIRALGFQGEAALDPLVEIAENGNSSDVAAAIEGLSHIPSPTARNYVVKHLDDQQPEIRRAVIRSLFRLPKNEREPLIDKLIPLGDGSEVEPFLLGKRSVAEAPHIESYSFRQKWGEPGIQTLLKLIHHQDDVIAEESIQLLGELEEPGAINPLLNIIQQKKIKPERLHAAVNALSRMHVLDSIPLLEGLLKRSKTQTSEKIIRALIHMNDSRTVATILHWFFKQPARRLTANIILEITEIILQFGNDIEILQFATRWQACRLKALATPKPWPRAFVSQADQWLTHVAETRKVTLRPPPSRKGWEY